MTTRWREWQKHQSRSQWCQGGHLRGVDSGIGYQGLEVEVGTSTKDSERSKQRNLCLHAYPRCKLMGLHGINNVVIWNQPISWIYKRWGKRRANFHSTLRMQGVTFRLWLSLDAGCHEKISTQAKVNKKSTSRNALTAYKTKGHTE